MTFESHIVAFCDRFLAQRTFELVVAPALADFAFEEAAGRRSRLANRVAVLRAAAGGVLHDAQRSSDVFCKILLLSMSYFMFPVFLSITAFKTWSAFLLFATIVFAMSVAPVIICFWPERRPMRLGE
jgi:hypothetical protein